MVKSTLAFISLVIAFIVSRALFVWLVAIGGNIRFIGGRFSFDPLITIAYMSVYYFITLFYQPSPKAQFYLFLFVLILSFTITFIQGSILLVFLYALLRKLKII